MVVVSSEMLRKPDDGSPNVYLQDGNPTSLVQFFDFFPSFRWRENAQPNIFLIGLADCEVLLNSQRSGWSIFENRQVARVTHR